MSKTISSHRAVQECECAISNGFDYPARYDVFLKEGYVFTLGRTEGCRSGVFKDVQEFVDAKPKKLNKKLIKEYFAGENGKEILKNSHNIDI